MATIKSQMALNDGMSAVLKKITSALDTTLASFEQVQRASGNAMDVSEIEAARAELAEASNLVDDLADNYRRAAQEEEQLNENINRGTSAMDGMVKKALSLVGAYMSINAIKGFATSSMEAANTQINAQVQLRTVLENMGAMDSYEALTNSMDGAELENTLTLNTAEAEGNYDAFAADITGNTLEAELVVHADNSGALSAYDAIVDKAAQIQGLGIYGDEAMIAGAAEFATYFEDANAIMSMMDTLTDYAMGMSGGGALDTSAMVDYATGLGKIMSGSYDAMTKKGFEFTDTQKAIIEGTATEAQIVAELGAEYLNMSSDMQAAATINNVIAEGWGGLYETMSNTPEGKLIQLNNTLGDIKENVGAGIYPAVVNLVNMVQSNTPQIESLAMGVATVLGFIITLLTGMAEGAIAFGTAVSDNWSWIGPIVYGIITALAIYVGYLGVMKAAELLSTGAKIAMCVASYAHAAATGTEASATAAATAAQYGFNTALLASPITWIVIAVIALVAGLVALCNWIAKTTGVAQTGFGVITGGINVVMQFFVNLGLTVANIALGMWNALGAVCSNIGTAFHNVIASVQSWFYGLLSTALTVVAGICEALNKLPFVEFDFSGITSKADEYAAKSAEAANSKEDYTSVADAFTEGFGTFDTFSDGWASDAFKAGAAWGDSVADQVGGMFDGLGYTPGTIDDFTNAAMGGSFAMDSLGSDVGDIADNTGSMAKSMDLSGEELKYLRDIAERDAINRFTTAEVKIDMTGMTNKIDGGADLDGVIRELTDGFTEALLTAAEGVHT